MDPANQTLTPQAWDVDDIEGLAHEVPAIKPDEYLDLEAHFAALEAAKRWPFLARSCLAAFEDAAEQVVDVVPNTEDQAGEEPDQP